MHCLLVVLFAAWLVESTLVSALDPAVAYPPIRPTCGLNEVYSECEANMCQNTCANPKKSITCKGTCIAGCVCADGFLRNSKGVCVLIKSCDNCKANQVFKDFGSFGCENSCAAPTLQTRCIASPNTLEPGCFCAIGFVRNEDNGECILVKDCPNKCTGAYEVYTECGNNSCLRDCDTYDRRDLPCRPSCESGCICIEGYARNRQGVCVPLDQCEIRICTEKNQVYTKCVLPCGERCSNLGQNIICNYLVCYPGCDCKPGFFKNSQNECVPPAECDCAANEQLDLCHNNCPPRTCDAIGKQFRCAAPDPNDCKPACKCILDYRRDSNGVCVPIEQCPPLTCTGENEIYNACPPRCLDETCTSLISPRVCTFEMRECAPACVCKYEFLRNAAGKCIPDSQCSCGDQNAEVINTPNPCPGGTCDQPEFSICRLAGKSRGCQCKKGYVKNNDGKCILLSKCPKKCGSYEIYAPCCPRVQETCATLGKTDFRGCKPGCMCNKGFVRNYTYGKCIKKSECRRRRK